jgi:hypothetical protein
MVLAQRSLAISLALMVLDGPDLLPQEICCCGSPDSVTGYSIEYVGERYELPTYVKIVRNGEVLFEDEEPRSWLANYNGVTASSFQSFLLLKTFSQDCVDIHVARLFMISPDGGVIHQPVWTSNWYDGFFVKDDRLMYWSEWFCAKAKEERDGDGSYVHVFSEASNQFELEEVPFDTYCARTKPLQFLDFAPLEIITRPR